MEQLIKWNIIQTKTLTRTIFSSYLSEKWKPGLKISLGSISQFYMDVYSSHLIIELTVFLVLQMFKTYWFLL